MYAYICYVMLYYVILYYIMLYSITWHCIILCNKILGPFCEAVLRAGDFSEAAREEAAGCICAV